MQQLAHDHFTEDVLRVGFFDAAGDKDFAARHHAETAASSATVATSSDCRQTTVIAGRCR